MNSIPIIYPFKPVLTQFSPIKKLFNDCDLHINIASDNFDISSVVLEAMILKKPTLNIQFHM